MPIHNQSRLALTNRLLTALPPREYRRLAPSLEPVFLDVNQVLYQPHAPIDQVYFPDDAVISIVSCTKEGWTVEVGMVGYEGVVGLHVLLGASPTPYLYMTLTRGTAHRIQAEKLKAEFQRGGALQSLFLRYTQARLIQFAQIHVCNYFHPIPKRICRWLLMVHDRTMSNELSLTQEAISQVLRVRRTGITEAMGTLQKEKLFSYHYGRITILDRGGLERTACECYETIRHGFNHLPKSGSPHSGKRSNRRLG